MNNKYSWLEARKLAEEGKKVAREEWGDKSKFVYYVPINKFRNYENKANKFFNGQWSPSHNHVVLMKDNFFPMDLYDPSKDDFFAEDWIVID
jgi:hypothetical protein